MKCFEAQLVANKSFVVFMMHCHHIVYTPIQLVDIASDDLSMYECLTSPRG